MIISLENITSKDASVVGSKALNLSKLINLGYEVPKGFCITTSAYLEFLKGTTVSSSISGELARRDMKDMRWEELWDASLRIRNLFSVTELPKQLRDTLADAFKGLKDVSLAIRSSAPGEDSASTSFAGLHESFTGVTGCENSIESVKLVWSSLWSDSALLYRRELNLQVESSSMAVVVQEMIEGDFSGVAFSKNPANGKDQIVIETVRGLNQKLVDGAADPCRYIIDKSSSKPVDITTGEYTEPPLSSDILRLLMDTIGLLERDLDYPFDMEWTIKDGQLYLLQVRPITTLTDDDEKPWEKDDKRPWYRSLTLTFTSLERLEKHITESVLPQMDKAASVIEGRPFKNLSDKDLATEIEERRTAYSHWKDVYWKDLIPFAHGVRLFGKLYNDTIKPADPYEFTRLLSTDDMVCIKRNAALADIADTIRRSPDTREFLLKGQLHSLEPDFKKSLDEFLGLFSASVFKGERIFTDTSSLIPLLLNASSGLRERVFSTPIELEKTFLEKFDPANREEILKVLGLARVSWKMRDDDNLYLGRIEATLLDTFALGRTRLMKSGNYSELTEDEVLCLLRGEESLCTTFKKEEVPDDTSPFHLGMRRFTGQPASPGIGSGRARVITSPEELFTFQKDEILVCDAIDPNMTFIVPMASAIIERRGGMLIHGAIIAREYGIPCVTGIEGATTYISTGDLIVVDGFLGTVSITDE